MLNYVRIDTVLTSARQGATSMPRYARGGVAWNDTIRRAGIPFTVAADAVYSSDYDRVMVPVGVEAWLLPSIAVRAGVNINHPSERFHAGVGVRWSSILFDFDYGLTQLSGSGSAVEQKWLLGLSYGLRAPKAASAVPVTAVSSGAAASILSTSVVLAGLEAGLLFAVPFDLPERCFYLLTHNSRHLSRSTEAFLDCAKLVPIRDTTSA